MLQLSLFLVVMDHPPATGKKRISGSADVAMGNAVIKL